MSEHKQVKREERLRKKSVAATKLAASISALEAYKKKPVASSLPITIFLQPFRHQFINPIDNYTFKTKSQSDERRFLELVKHAFAKYKTPHQLFGAWIQYYHDMPKFTSATALGLANTVGYHHHSNKTFWCQWYITVAQGGSLYKEHAKPYMTKNEVHTFLNTSYDLSLEQLMVFSIAKTFVANDGIALRIAKTKLDDHVCSGPQNKVEFIKTVIYFFAKNPPATINEANDLLDFILFKYNAMINELDHPHFTMAGQTLESLRKKTTDWHYALRRIKDMGNHNWEGAPINDETYHLKNEFGVVINWHFTQIKNSKALAAEGNTMRHCVYSYRDSCSRNELSIWSLSREEKAGVVTKKVTIELKNNGHIVQARGVGNRALKNDERRALELWAKNNYLTIAATL